MKHIQNVGLRNKNCVDYDNDNDNKSNNNIIINVIIINVMLCNEQVYDMHLQFVLLTMPYHSIDLIYF